MSRLPDFIIIGAAKCGTTTLYKKLATHPNVFMSTPKEPEFFARDDIYQKGLDWYTNLFALASNAQLCGEASTLYSLTTLFPDTVTRMYDAVPQVKLIYVLREPVQRSYSYYTQLVKNHQKSTRNFKVNRTFEECLFPEQYPDRCDRELFFAPFDKHLPDDPRTLIDGSRYMTHINNYLSLFDRKQLLIVNFKDLVETPDDVMASVCNFLNLEVNELPNNVVIRENISSEHFGRVDKEIARQGLVTKVKASALGRKLIKIMPKKMKTQLLDYYTLLFNKTNDNSKPAKISAAAKNYLHNTFEDEVLELEKFWHRDLSSWKQKP
jgi:Sulfotransferase domain